MLLLFRVCSPSFVLLRFSRVLGSLVKYDKRLYNAENYALAFSGDNDVVIFQKVFVWSALTSLGQASYFSVLVPRVSSGHFDRHPRLQHLQLSQPEGGHKTRNDMETRSSRLSSRTCKVALPQRSTAPGFHSKY